MTEARITDPVKAQAAVAYLIAEGWQMNLHELHKSIPGGLQPQDWLALANGCMDFVMNKLAEDKVIPIARFKRSNA